MSCLLQELCCCYYWPQSKLIPEDFEGSLDKPGISLTLQLQAQVQHVNITTGVDTAQYCLMQCNKYLVACTHKLVGHMP